MNWLVCYPIQEGVHPLIMLLIKQPFAWAFVMLRFGGVMPSNASENMAVSLALAALSFVVTLIIGRPIVTILRTRKYGKKIRIEGPESHQVKTGTPTMGGLMIVLTVIVITAVFNLAGRLSMLLPTGILLAATFLGVIDDRMSLVGGTRMGLPAGLKFAWLALIGVAAALILHLPKPFGLGLHYIYIPFLGKYPLAWEIYVPIAALGIIGTANAVNLTDGLDMLAGGTAAIAFVAYGIIAYVQGQLGVVTFCFTMTGALLGFIWFNAYPAQVFMGDTGALAIGAVLATASFMTGQWLLLPVVGGVFVAETMSVVLQVGFRRLSKRLFGLDRRLFKMAPLHHHFEMLGWSETQVTLRFWLLGMVAGLLGVALALL